MRVVIVFIAFSLALNASVYGQLIGDDGGGQPIGGTGVTQGPPNASPPPTPEQPPPDLSKIHISPIALGGGGTTLTVTPDLASVGQQIDFTDVFNRCCLVGLTGGTISANFSGTFNYGDGTP
jgi:hypothetical protein